MRAIDLLRDECHDIRDSGHNLAALADGLSGEITKLSEALYSLRRTVQENLDDNDTRPLLTPGSRAVLFAVHQSLDSAYNAVDAARTELNRYVDEVTA